MQEVDLSPQLTRPLIVHVTYGKVRYEKTRCMSTYNRGGPSASSSSAYSSNPNPSVVSMGDSGSPILTSSG
ncbi:hypothetical protein F4680DRAFT_306650 [Xylaria scruposa]|nr:hypothetical protein F4680DRAFT_306650 [Xylaria scruposa]